MALSTEQVPLTNANDAGARDRLFRAAIELFNRRGYPATTVREIVEAAGVTKPVLYYYFGSKEGIYLALLEEARKAFQSHVDAVRESQGRVRERIFRLARRLFLLFQENIEVVRLVHAIYYGPPQGAPPFDFDSFYHTFQDVLEHLIEEGIRTGELRSGKVSPMATALHGATAACMEIALAHPEVALDVAELDQVLEVVFQGIARQKGRDKEQSI
jgi:AcrR family transcriptional regulator